MLDGAISITDLPPHRGLIVNLCLFPVAGPDAPAPHGGHPPAQAATDCHEVFKQVDLDAESQVPAFEHPFAFERPPGYYYLQLRVILFRTQGGKAFGQAEQFFFGRRPIRVTAGSCGPVTLPVSWPTEPLEALHHYGTVKPQRSRPWWRVW